MPGGKDQQALQDGKLTTVRNRQLATGPHGGVSSPELDLGPQNEPRGTPRTSIANPRIFFFSKARQLVCVSRLTLPLTLLSLSQGACSAARWHFCIWRVSQSFETPGLGFVWCSGKRDARDRSSRLPFPLKPLLNSAPPSLISLSASSWPGSIFFRVLRLLPSCSCAGTACAASSRLDCTAAPPMQLQLFLGRDLE